MNDASSKIEIIQSRLPYTDRRALSEAWFSALHLASDGAPARSVPERRGVACGPARAEQAAHAGTIARGRAVTGVAAPFTGGRRMHASPVASSDAAERLRPARKATSPHVLAATRGYPPFRTSLTIGLGKGRVQLLLRREGATLHVIALCRPQAVETVRRALALADAHLRMRGESVRSSVHAFAGTMVSA